MRIFPLLAIIQIKFEVFNWSNISLSACYTETDAHRTHTYTFKLINSKNQVNVINKLYMKDIYNVGKKLRVIRPKIMEVMPALIFRKTLSIRKYHIWPKGKFPPNKKYGSHPLCNTFKIIVKKTMITGAFLHNLDNSVQQCAPS